MKPTTPTSPPFAATSELPFWLALWRTPGINGKHFFTLLRLFPQLSTLFHATFNQLAALGLTTTLLQNLQNPNWTGVATDLRWAEQANHHIITWADVDYPPLLKQIADPPPILFIAGNPEILSTPQLAIVGSRNPTPAGLEIAQQFAADLSQTGITITSGLALGIDAAAHQGALRSQGPTLAVLGCGLDQIYPRRHTALAAQIIKQGALVSEFPVGTDVKAMHFPKRNRLVSGLSLGVLVVEAALRSGSLITARLAAEQNREVFAIPSSIYNPYARGCHALIKQGAKLAETLADILEELPLTLPKQPLSSQPDFGLQKNSLDADCQQLLECAGYEISSIDQLVTRSGLDITTVLAKISLLELEGILSAVPGGYIRLKQPL